MPALPKPPSCHQNWLAMPPTQNGRLCGQCEKEIYDFSTMSWEAIVQTQAAHGNALCGMYSPAQLKHWGQPPPSACAQLAAATTLALALAAIPAPAQTVVPAAATRLVLSGTVQQLFSNGTSEPITYATVLIGHTNMLQPASITTVTDVNGHYELTIPDAVSAEQTDTLFFNAPGFVGEKWAIPPHSYGLVQRDAVLTQDPRTVCSVQKPSFVGRIRRRLRHPFSPRY